MPTAQGYLPTMHHVWVILKVLIIAKLVMLAVLGVALFWSFKRNKRRLITHA